MVTATTEAGLSAVAPCMPYLMPDYTADTFQPYVGQMFTFEAVHQSAVLGLKLLQISRRPGGKAAGFRESFSLLFTRPCSSTREGSEPIFSRAFSQATFASFHFSAL